ncbi:hypothetical protein MTO96_027676 [Rhipicephalus appendiculatus]
MKLKINDEERDVFPVVNESGVHVAGEQGGLLYATEDGLRISVVFVNEATGADSSQQNDSQVMVASQVATTLADDIPVSCPPADDFEETHPGTSANTEVLSDTEREVWLRNQTLFLISKYKELNDVDIKKGGFSELAEVLEKQHHVTPTVLVTQGRVMVAENSLEQDTDTWQFNMNGLVGVKVLVCVAIALVVLNNEAAASLGGGVGGGRSLGGGVGGGRSLGGGVGGGRSLGGGVGGGRSLGGGVGGGRSLGGGVGGGRSLGGGVGGGRSLGGGVGGGRSLGGGVGGGQISRRWCRRRQISRSQFNMNGLVGVKALVCVAVVLAVLNNEAVASLGGGVGAGRSLGGGVGAGRSLGGGVGAGRSLGGGVGAGRSLGGGVGAGRSLGGGVGAGRSLGGGVGGGRSLGGGVGAGRSLGGGVGAGRSLGGGVGGGRSLGGGVGAGRSLGGGVGGGRSLGGGVGGGRSLGGGVGGGRSLGGGVGGGRAIDRN